MMKLSDNDKNYSVMVSGIYMTEKRKSVTDPTEDAVLDYLRQNPDFLEKHPELMEILTPPQSKDGDNIVDLQHYMARELQNQVRSLKDKFEGLVTSSRDNMSTLNQVHASVLRLMKARSLEQLLEALTIDLTHLFNIDVVRLAVESPAAGQYDTCYSEENYSGIAFIDPGAVLAALGQEDHLLVEDVRNSPVVAFDQIFEDCSGLVRSCALLQLRLPRARRDALLAFGERRAGRFHPGQGVELLTFLAQIVEYRLDQCLDESGIGEAI